MSYIGGTPYDAGRCPQCGGVTWNGRCEDPDCICHWQSISEEEDLSEENEDTLKTKFWRKELC